MGLTDGFTSWLSHCHPIFVTAIVRLIGTASRRGHNIMTNDGEDRTRDDKALQKMVEAAMQHEQLSETFRLYQQAASAIPAPVLINTGVVRYSTGGNA